MKNFMRLLIALSFLYSHESSGQQIIGSQLLTLPNDSFKLELTSFFGTGTQSCCPQLETYTLSTQNDTLYVSLFSEIVLCPTQSCWRTDTLNLGQIPSGTVNVIRILPGEVWEQAPNDIDTNYYVQYIKWLLFPWVNSVGSIPAGEKVLNVFPNPATDRLVLQSKVPLEIIANVCLFTMAGKKVFEARQQRINTTSSEIDISRLETGIYMLVVRTNNFIYYEGKLEVIGR